MGTGYQPEKIFGHRWVLGTGQIFNDADPCYESQSNIYLGIIPLFLNLSAIYTKTLEEYLIKYKVNIVSTKFAFVS